MYPWWITEVKCSGGGVGCVSVIRKNHHSAFGIKFVCFKWQDSMKLLESNDMFSDWWFCQHFWYFWFSILLLGRNIANLTTSFKPDKHHPEIMFWLKQLTSINKSTYNSCLEVLNHVFPLKLMLFAAMFSCDWNFRNIVDSKRPENHRENPLVWSGRLGRCATQSGDAPGTVERVAVGEAQVFFSAENPRGFDRDQLLKTVLVHKSWILCFWQICGKHVNIWTKLMVSCKTYHKYQPTMVRRC